MPLDRRASWFLETKWKLVRICPVHSSGRVENLSKISLDKMVARGGIEPPTRGFSVGGRGFYGLINQPLVALASPEPSLTKAQLRHTKSEFDTFSAHPASRLLGHHLAVFPNVKRSAIHARRLACILLRRAATPVPRPQQNSWIGPSWFASSSSSTSLQELRTVA